MDQMPNRRELEPVIFRVWKAVPYTVIALLPEIKEGPHSNLCCSYEHVGQHGAADPDIVKKVTRPARPEEYNPLAEELMRVGYKLDIRQRKTKRGK